MEITSTFAVVGSSVLTLTTTAWPVVRSHPSHALLFVVDGTRQATRVGLQVCNINNKTMKRYWLRLGLQFLFWHLSVSLCVPLSGRKNKILLYNTGMRVCATNIYVLRLSYQQYTISFFFRPVDGKDEPTLSGSTVAAFTPRGSHGFDIIIRR